MGLDPHWDGYRAAEGRRNSGKSEPVLSFRPEAGKHKAVFQLHPNGWHFAPGHVARLQLLGRDAPFARASNGTFSVTASHLQLRLPVHEHPGGQVKAPLRPLGRNGLPAKPSKLALR